MGSSGGGATADARRARIGTSAGEAPFARRSIGSRAATGGLPTWLRDQIDAFYESHASAFLKNPWEARDAYIDVILDRSPDGLATWLARHRRVLLDAAAQVETRQLLEM